MSADGKVDRPTWKVMQQIMNDSQKFVDSLHNIPWKNGLSDDIFKGVQSFFATSSSGEIGTSDLGSAAPGASASTYVARAPATPSGELGACHFSGTGKKGACHFSGTLA